MEGTGVGGQKVGLASGRFWQIIVVTAAGAIGAPSRGEAAIYYFENTLRPVVQPAPKAAARRAKTHHSGEKKSEIVENESAKPRGALIISISIAQQKLRIYDANGLFAETPVSTGMPGHSTPMGV
ncbi:MAG TPA: L,D-transpeptidase, partial [Bradyrhizobium sp.]|nr:L,D-transpeptidase [Bradyrhizobium sp.]